MGCTSVLNTSDWFLCFSSLDIRKHPTATCLASSYLFKFPLSFVLCFVLVLVLQPELLELCPIPMPKCTKARTTKAHSPSHFAALGARPFVYIFFFFFRKWHVEALG